MLVSKWGDSLAVRLPKALVEALNLSPGDELDVVEARKDRISVEKVDKRAEFLRQVEQFHFALPQGYKFDRDEANERVSAFFDTNVLVYAYSTDNRRQRALTVIASGGVVSAQVLNEFTSVLRRRQKQDWAIIEAAVRSVRFWFPDIVPLTADTHAAALGFARDHALAFHDALIVAAAAESGCETLYSEDLQHGRSIGGLAIINPFL
jgi:predicted nucleic acid-binding protein